MDALCLPTAATPPEDQPPLIADADRHQQPPARRVPRHPAPAPAPFDMRGFERAGEIECPRLLHPQSGSLGAVQDLDEGYRSPVHILAFCRIAYQTPIRREVGLSAARNNTAAGSIPACTRAAAGNRAARNSRKSRAAPSAPRKPRSRAS